MMLETVIAAETLRAGVGNNRGFAEVVRTGSGGWSSSSGCQYTDEEAVE